MVRFGWREGLVLVSALGRGARDSDPTAESLSVRALARVAACRRAGGLEALGRLPLRERERLLTAETKATRGALAHLGDLGLVVWDYSFGTDGLSYRLTDLGWEAAMCFGRRTTQAGAAGLVPAVAPQGGMALAAGG
jgi:hypothetical protein